MTAVCKEKQGTVIKNSRANAVCSFVKGIYILAAKLHGKLADAFCMFMADKMGRYVAGCPKLVEEIQANAKSNAPINAMARQALAASDAMTVAAITQADLDAIRNDMKQEMIQMIKKSDESTRRKILNDERRADKRKLNEIQVGAAVHERKNKSDIELAKETVAKEQAITKEIIARAQAETNKHAMEIELVKLKAQVAQVPLAIQVAQVAQVPLAIQVAPTEQVLPEPTEPTNGITVKSVALKHQLITEADLSWDAIVSQAGINIKKEGLRIYGEKLPEPDINARIFWVNQYHPSDEQTIVRVLSDCIAKHVPRNTTGSPVITSFFNRVTPIPTATPVNGASVTIHINK